MNELDSTVASNSAIEMTSITKTGLLDNSGSSVESEKDVKTYRNIQNIHVPPVTRVEIREGKTCSNESVASYKQIRYRIYPWRWFMLLAVCLLNVSNGMVKIF